jgi:hypothetical protein
LTLPLHVPAAQAWLYRATSSRVELSSTVN